ncbi:hypothetical protein Bbelb_313090 [Branchiostoma belcheri]|nr:hypothetical protein Bbelb_313090 [Branchiostoma belcheri]
MTEEHGKESGVRNEMSSPLNEDVNKDMENEVELPAIDHNYDVVEQDEILNEPQTGEQTSAGTPPEDAGNNIADPLGNAIHDPGPPQQKKDGGCTASAVNIYERLKSYKCPGPSLLRFIAIVIPVVALLGAGACVFMYLSSMENKNADPPIKGSPNKRMPALSKMAPAQDWLVTTLPDNTTELTQTADTLSDQSKSLPGLISTDKTGISTNLILETAPLTTEKDWTFPRPPPVHGDSFDNTNGPRCKNGYKLLTGTCIRLITALAMNWLFGKSHDGAKEACRKEGATLAMPKTKELDVALRDLVKTEGGNKEHWIGMEEKEGTWYWMDGSKVGQNGYKGWNAGEPGGWSCGQYWAKSSSWLFSGSGYPMWDDDACFNKKRFICQRPPA